MKIYFYLTLIILALNGCGNGASSIAKNMCDCLKEKGLKDGLNMRDIERNLSRGSEECMLNLGKEIYGKMKDMTDTQRAEFMKQLSKSLLDTDCADIAFKTLPYDEMMRQLERSIERESRRSNNNMNFGFNGPSVCDCVNARNTDPDIRKACEKLEKEWKERYEQGSESEREEMIEEIKACEEK